MKKKILKKLALLMSIFFCLMPIQAHAAPSENYLICFVAKEGTIQTACPGVPVNLNGTYTVFSLKDLYLDGGDYYLVADMDNSEYVPMDYKGVNMDMLLFTVTYNDSSLFYDYAAPVIGETATLISLGTEYIYYVDVKINGYVESDYYVLDCSLGSTENDNYVGVIVNSKKQAIAFCDESGTAYALLEPISSSQGENPTASPSPTSSPSETPKRGESTPVPASSDEPTSAPTDAPADDPTPAPTDDPDPSPNVAYLIVIASAAVVVAVLVVVIIIVVNRSKKQAKTNPANQVIQVSPPQDIFGSDQSFDQKTMPVWEHVQAENPPVSPNEGSKSIELYLIGVDGPLRGLEYCISEKTITIGRAVECNICYPADTKGVSRRHCQIFWKNGGLMIMDLGSTSGTFLREKGQLQPNTPIAIKEGDVIYLGSKQNAFTIQIKGKN